MEQLRDQFRFHECSQELRRLVRRHRPNVVLIEDCANGTALIPFIRKHTSSTVIGIHPGQDSKAARLARHVALIRRKPIFLPATFLGQQSFIEEILGPRRTTDQLDALTQMLDYVSNNIIPSRPAPAATAQGVGSSGPLFFNPRDLPDASTPGLVVQLGARRRWPWK